MTNIYSIGSQEDKDYSQQSGQHYVPVVYLSMKPAAHKPVSVTKTNKIHSYC